MLRRQLLDLSMVQRQHVRMLEELAIEALYLGPDFRRVAAYIHLCPQAADQRDELPGSLHHLFEQFLEGFLRQ